MLFQGDTGPALLNLFVGMFHQHPSGFGQSSEPGARYRVHGTPSSSPMSHRVRMCSCTRAAAPSLPILRPSLNSRTCWDARG